MSLQYNKDAVGEIAYVPLPHDVLAEIGGLVRAVAEVEEMLNLYLAALADLQAHFIPTLIGRANIRRKVVMAEELLAWRSTPNDPPLVREIYEKWFKPAAFKEALDCRNAAAHGFYMGCGNDIYVFRVDRYLVDDGSHGQEAYGYDINAIKAHRRYFENIISQIETRQLEPFASFRKRRRSTPPEDHPKSRRSKGGGAKPRNPPPSSRP